MLAFLEGMASGLGGEVVTYTSSNTVTITSPNRLDSQGHKCSVSAPLGAPLRVSASPQWEEMGGAAGLGKVLSAVESVSNAMAGVSLTQPSMYRRYYKGTDPLSFEAVLNFYATSEVAPSRGRGLKLGNIRNPENEQRSPSAGTPWLPLPTGTLGSLYC